MIRWISLVSAAWLWTGDLGVVTTISLSLIPAYVLAIGAGITGGAVATTPCPNEGTWRALRATGMISLAAGMPLLFMGLAASLGIRGNALANWLDQWARDNLARLDGQDPDRSRSAKVKCSLPLMRSL